MGVTRAQMEQRWGLPWRFQFKEEETLCGTVERISPTDTYAHVEDANGMMWHVPLELVEAMSPLTLDEFLELAQTHPRTPPMI